MKGFLQYIHNLRGLAILYVVVVHARALNPEWLSHPGVNRFFDTFFDPSEGNGTVLFLFIGGFLFQHLTNKNFDFVKYIEQKFKVIILPYVLISVPLIVIRLNTTFVSLSLPDGFDDRSIIFRFFYFLLTGAHMPPFWFIATIVLFYLTAPLLHALDNVRFYNYVFPFVLLISFLTFRPQHNANPLMAYVHYLPIYILGMWTSFNKERILAYSDNLLPIAAAIYTTLCVLDLTGSINLSRELTFENVLYDGLIAFNIYVFKAVVLCFMLMLLLYRMSEYQIPSLTLLGNYSFGIFFVHYLFISISRKAVEAYEIDIPFSIPAYLLYFAFVLLSSIVVVYFIKKLAGDKSRYLIGS
jgi:probable poly-beta-1,6-N-acetyl-D-glucosamine export protein